MVGLQPAGNAGKQGRSPQVEGAIGGFRYHVEHINVRVQADCTAESTIIWRLMDESVEGDPGATLISTRKDGGGILQSGWEVTAFQSSNLLGDGFEMMSNPFPSQYWKLAGRPTANLMRAYSVFIPDNIIHEFERSLDTLLSTPEGQCIALTH